jgi:outer membrane protein
MNRKIIKRLIFQSIVLFFVVNSNAYGQNNSITDSDSLSLKTIIERVVSSHPNVKVAEEAINNSDARIALAKTGYLPEADVTANFSNMGPVTKLSIPNMGTFQLFPENNYSASINYRQLVYDFGRTKQNIDLESGVKNIAEQNIEQVKQRMSLFAVNNFYFLLFIQAAIKIKDEQLTALNSHLEYVKKMMETGSATEYQILTTEVKISTVESQKVDLRAALTAQQSSLNSLLGNDQKAVPIVKNELITDIPAVQSDSLLSFAFTHRDEVLMNERKTSLAGLKLDLIKLQNKPVISFIASAGGKNGYVPELSQIKPNYILGLGIRIPVFDGNKNKYNISQAQSAITSLSYESEYTKRNISNEIQEAEAYMFAAGKKVNQFELQVKQALKAYSLAETSFKSGSITNLDLLDANTSVSESRLLLLKARIDYAASIYKLKVALGERIY